MAVIDVHPLEASGELYQIQIFAIYDPNIANRNTVRERILYQNIIAYFIRTVTISVN